MSLISIPFTYSAGAVIVASQHNSCNSVIYSDFNGNIDNNNIATSAAIAYSKLNLALGIVNADVSASAAIVASKLVLTSPGAIGTVAPAAVKATTLEATTTLKLGTTNQGDILYDNATSLVRLPPGTSGYFLKTQGASANPTWAAQTAPGLTLISTTSVSAATTSGNIAITSTNNYLVVVNAKEVGGGGNVISIRANADTGNNYNSGYSGRGSAAATGASSASGASIICSAGMQGNAGFNMVFYINQDLSNANYLHFFGTINGLLVTANYGISQFGGQWVGAATPTSFSVIGSANYTGTIYLYSIALS